MTPHAAVAATDCPLRVLVVDDDGDAVELLVMLLQMEGLDACGCSRPLDVAERVQQLRPDVVVTDLHMPGLDGMALARALRTRHPALRLVALTGEEGAARAGDGLAFDAVLGKPVDIDALVAVLQSMRG